MFSGRGTKHIRENESRQKTCRYYDTIASKTPQPKRPLPTKSIWRSRLPMCKKCWQADQVIKEEKTNRLKKAHEKEWHRRKNDCRENPIASKDKERSFYKWHYCFTQKKNMRSNGLRYPLVGGTRQRHFGGTNFKPRKVPENAQTPTSRVHAVLGNRWL